MSKELVNPIEILPQMKKVFLMQNSYNLKWESECLFAKQLITKQELTYKTAQNNPESLKSAVYNVAAIGISLNPATAHAYLVPRNGAICLDISFRGLVKLATDSGSIEWAKAGLVWEDDGFEYTGPFTLPTFAPTQNPFKDIKSYDTILGAYCVAKLTTGDYMVELMSKADLDKVKDSSKAANGPWKTWPEEMAKKSVIKRASKSWPQSSDRDRLDKAVEVLNEHEGLAIEPVSFARLEASPDQRDTFSEMLTAKDSEFAAWFTSLDQEIQISLYNSFSQGEKGKGKELVKAKADKGLSVLADVGISIMESSDDSEIAELASDLNDLEWSVVLKYLDDEKSQIALEARMEAA